MSTTIRLGALMLAALVGGCSLPPDYQRPQAPLPERYAGTDEAPTSAATPAWREFFPDRRLQRLIDTALTSNRDLRRAVLDIQAARAAYGIQRSEELPQLGASTSAARTRTPSGLSATGSAVTRSQYEVGLTVTAWELDFFGRVQSLSEAALARYLASEEARRAVQVSLVAEVARTYLAERALAERLALARQTLAARREAYGLVEQRYGAGASSKLDLRQAEVLVRAAEVAVAALTREHAQAANALALLVGTELNDLPEPTPLAEQTLVTVPAGLPAELLERRPDIRAAEQRLIAANANIGAARAAFFPRITLTAGAGLASNELAGLFDGNTGTWSFIPRLTLPIFDAGRNQRSLELAEVRKEQAVVDYEQAIRQAFYEVADALAALSALDEQLAAQAQLLAAQRERLALAEQRYEAGVANYLEVLDARRELFDAEQNLVQTRRLRLNSAIDLYRALGGGVEAP